ncbi:MAG: hypothetical protein Fur0041_07430 [Bacteroidia bacterium]
MKKTLTFLLIAFSLNLSAQAFREGDIIASAGAGIAIYKYQFTDVTNNSVTPRDTSGAWTFPFSAEYGVTNWLGGVFTFNYNNYIEGDSATDENATGIDFLIGAGFHVPWNLNRFDLTGNISYGFSKFKYQYNGSNSGTAKATGPALFVTINPRFYFSSSRNIGMGFFYRYSTYNYNNGEIKDNAGNTSKFKIEGPGNSFGLNLFYNIHSKE